MLDATAPALILAPMEGVTDAPMRAVMGETGAFSFAVSEFLRVSHAVLPRGVFHKHVPELLHGCRTPTGLRVQVQLLGGDPALMAESAAVAHAAGATAIDINFGCPAPTVNRHDGGATLLKYPTRIRAIVAAVRAALPATVPLSAKLRLGWDTRTPIDENAAMAAEGGAAWITIHARTRAQGYAPPVDWTAIGRVRQRLGIPIVANGDIHSLADFHRCRDITGCVHYMLGRGALANPRLPRLIAAQLGVLADFTAEHETVIDWATQLRRLVDWARQYPKCRGAGSVQRLKQWLKMAWKFGDFDQFDAIKECESIEELLARLERHPVSVADLGRGLSL